MKKIYLLTILFLTIKVYSQEIDQDDYLNRMSVLLNNYETLLIEKGTEGTNYYKAFKLFKEKVVQEKTNFRLDLENDNLIDGGAHFNVGKDDPELYYISIGYKLIDVYDNYPSIVYSIITHEIWHAYGYISDRQAFTNQHIDPFEEFFYESDAIHVEAEFISDLLVKEGLELTNYENYLLDSYNKGNMINFISTAIKGDLYIVDSLSQIKYQYFESKDKKALESSLYQVALNILGYYESEEERSDFFEYLLLVALDTYTSYSVILFQQTVSHEYEDMTWDELFNMFPKYKEVYDKIRIIVDPKEEYIKERYNRYITGFNKQLQDSL